MIIAPIRVQGQPWARVDLEGHDTTVHELADRFHVDDDAMLEAVLADRAARLALWRFVAAREGRPTASPPSVEEQGTQVRATRRPDDRGPDQRLRLEWTLPAASVPGLAFPLGARFDPTLIEQSRRVPAAAGPAVVSASGCRLDTARARAVLDRPVRTLTLEDAAYAVAWLHQEGRITLTDAPRRTRPPQPVPLPRPPEFGATCDVLTHPGRRADRGGRFVVALLPAVQAELRGGGTRTIEFVYVGGHGDDPRRTPDPRLHNVDVRLVLVMWHLANALANLTANDLHVQRVLHSGLGSGRGDAERIASRRSPPTVLLDCHFAGRAIDFDGVLTGRDLATSTPIRVSRNWNSVQVDGMPLLVRDDADMVANDWSAAATGWPVARGSGPNWILVEPKARFGGDPSAAERAMTTWLHGRTAFTDTRFRLAPDLDGTGVRAQAAHVFRAALVTLHGHCTVGAPIYAQGADVAPGDWTALAHSGALLHPDHGDPVYRQWHYDHIHAQVGPTAYEWPDADAPARDLQGHPTEAARRRAQQPHRVHVVAPRRPRDPDV